MPRNKAPKKTNARKGISEDGIEIRARVRAEFKKRVEVMCEKKDWPESILVRTAVDEYLGREEPRYGIGTHLPMGSAPIIPDNSKGPPKGPQGGAAGQK
jgi:hypothetical protein